MSKRTNIQKLEDIIRHSKTLKRLGALSSHRDFQLLVDMTSFLPATALIQTRIWHVENTISSIPTCKICDNNVTWRKEFRTYNMYCSSKCAHSDQAVLEKTKQTNLRRYGHSTAMQNKKVRKKIVSGWVDRYGVDNPTKSPEVRNRLSNSLFKSRNKNAFNKPIIKDMISEGLTQAEIGKSLGISQPRVSKLLQRMNITTKRTPYSVAQKNIQEFLLSISSDNVVLNERTIIPPYELDVFVPHRNIAIEFNGVFFHSELSGKPRSYHLQKTRLCDKENIRLIHIFDNEWIHKRDIVVSRLTNIFNKDKRIHARLSTVQEIDSRSANKFIERCHIQGKRPASVNLGLFYNDSLVSVMTFSKAKQYEYEMIRYCCEKGIAVIGGASKLFAYFNRTFRPKSVLSYADRRWSNGNLYQQLGFVFSGYTQPNYWYFYRNGDTSHLYSRVVFQKHKLPKLIDKFNPAKTEWENMQLNGYDRIWDCGSSRWVWKT